MSLLTDGLPAALLVDGTVYPIDSGYRAGIQFEKAVISGAADIQQLLTPFYGNTITHNPAAALRMAAWFYACGRREKPTQGSQKALSAYSFEQDEDVLYTSFYEAYGIDLISQNLHWWTFRRLMFGLPSESQFMRLVDYRTADISKLPKSQQKFYKEMREKYSLNGGKKLTLEERNAQFQARIQTAKALAEALTGGGDPRGKD